MTRLHAPRLHRWLLGAAAWAFAASAFALSESAIFSIDTTAHTGRVLRLAVLPGERQAVTAGFDKTVRIWNLEDGRLLKRWVVPVEDEADGKLAAMAVSPDGNRLAVGGRLIGFDGRLRTVLVLDIRSGQVVSKLTEFLSDVTALAWSPDGRYLAVGSSGAPGMGGVDGASIELFDTTTWGAASSDKELSGYIHDLAFGRGNALVATIEDRRVQMWAGNAPGGWARNPRGGASGANRTSKFLLRAYFCPNGLCVLQKQIEHKRKDLVRAYALADGDIFVGGEYLFDAGKLVERPHRLEFQLGGEDEVLGVQSASAAGAVYAISGSRHSRSSVIHRWSSFDRPDAERVRIPDSQISDFRVLSDGRLVYVSESGVLAAYGGGLNLLWRNSRPIAGSVSNPEMVQTSADGLWVVLPDGSGDVSRAMAFRLNDPRFQASHSISTEWIAPRTANSFIALTGWQRGEHPMVNQRGFPLSSGESSTTVAVHAVDESFVFGSNLGRVRRVVANGSATWTRYFHSEVIAVRQVEARKWVIVVTADGFVRVLRERDGETLVSYYVEPAARKWIAVSDHGYYEAGIGADDLAGWIVNRDPDHLADFFPLSRFRDTYLLPGYAEASLHLDDQHEAVRQLRHRRNQAVAGGRAVASAVEAEAAVRLAARQEDAVRRAEEERMLAEQQAEAARQREEARILAGRIAEATRLAELQRIEDEKQRQLAQAKAELARLQAIAATAVTAGKLAQLGAPSAAQLPPVVDVLHPGFNVATGEPKLKVRYRLKTPEGAPVIRVQGRVVARSQVTRGLLPKTGGDAQEIDFDLPGEDAEIQIVAENRWGPSVPATIKVRWQGAVPKARALKGDLHIIAVGVSDYDEADYKLGLASKDAQDFVATLRKQEGGLYGKIQLKILTDRQADKRSVEEAILGLRGLVQPQDTTMVFLAGHGVNDVGGEYVYLPRDARLESLGQTGVSFRLIRDTLARLPGRAVMFVDTCHSGNVIGRLRPGQSKDYTAAINELASSENNIIVFASSTGTQLSLEDPSWGNGAFTKALVEGLNGEADMKKRGRVTYKQLDAYVSDRVDELTQGRQTPVTPVLQGVPDFPLAEVRR